MWIKAIVSLLIEYTCYGMAALLKQNQIYLEQALWLLLYFVKSAV